VVPEPLRLVVLGASGDAYLVCALVDAFKAHHGRPDVTVVLREKLVPIAKLFPQVRWLVDESVVDQAETNQAFQQNHDNLLLRSGTFYAHPSFARSAVRADQLTATERLSQADMYRALLGLPFDTPLALPTIPPVVREIGSIFVIEDSTSWRNDQKHFWVKLVRVLRSDGWRVTVNDKAEKLDRVLERCARADWVIGPQCGVMSVLATGRFPCRKTFATPSTDHNKHDHPWAKSTFPYAYVTKFAGEDHDVEEHKVTDTNHDAIIEAIRNGPNALRLRSHDPSPTLSILMPLTPGDLLDRQAVLEVKMEKFSLERQAMIRRERDRYAEAAGRLPWSSSLRDLNERLVVLHRRAFGLLEAVVPAVLGSTGCETLTVEQHSQMIRYNRERVQLKTAIDELLHAPYLEVKSYHG
jgi:hypothetical protein